jgi:hypothetical protein
LIWAYLGGGSGLGAPFEALDDDLLDVHLCAGAVDSTAESKIKGKKVVTSVLRVRLVVAINTVSDCWYGVWLLCASLDRKIAA